MEAKFRPIPITIMDFLGVLIPGLLWSLLGIKTYYILSDPSERVSGMLATWNQINSIAPSEKAWMGPVSLILIALVAGYGLKPLAMPIANYLCKPIFVALPSVRRSQVKCRQMNFPFQPYFEPQLYYAKVGEIISKATGIKDVSKLPGSAPFSAAKRYLHATAPALWEESERMEAEVRMAGALFLAATYSTVLHGILYFSGYKEGITCAALSFLGAFALGFGFCILRLREVGYTYLNLILAEGVKASTSESTNADNKVETES